MECSFLPGMSEVALTVMALSLAAALGLLLGRFQVHGVGLGIGGVLFAGIFVGDIPFDTGQLAAITAALGLPWKGGVQAMMRGTPATEAVATDIWAEATIGNLPPGT